MNVPDNYRCNHNCNQGRRCPARQECQLPEQEPDHFLLDIAKWSVASILGVWAVAVIIDYLQAL